MTENKATQVDESHIFISSTGVCFTEDREPPRGLLQTFLAKRRIGSTLERVPMHRMRPDSEPPPKRPARGVSCAASIAGFAPSDAYHAAVKLVSACVISSAAFQPPEPVACSAVQQAVRDKTSKYSLGWHGKDTVAFL